MSPALPAPEVSREEYLTVAALCGRIPYAEQTIRNFMNQGVFRLGEHYVKPRGRVMFVWSAVEAWLREGREHMTATSGSLPSGPVRRRLSGPPPEVLP